MKDPVSLHPSQHCFCLFDIATFLVGVKWPLIGVLIHVSLITNDVQQLFMFVGLFKSLEKCLFMSLSLTFYLLSCNCSLYILDMSPVSE